MANKYCRNCGQELRPDDHLCPGCRKSVHETQSLPIPEANVPVVYLPPQKNEASTQDGQDSLGGLRHFLLSVAVPVLGTGAGVLALVGALLYVVGLVALLLPIWNIYTHNLADAWYETSLAPRTMVIGLGIGQLLTMPMLLSLVVTIWFVWTVREVEFGDRQISKRTRHLVSTLLLTLVFFLSFLVGIRPLLELDPDPLPPRYARYALIGWTAIGMFIGLFKWSAIEWADGRRDEVGTEHAPKESEAATSTNEDKTRPLGYTPRQEVSLIFLLKYVGTVAGIVFLYMLLAALAATYAQAPPLPKAELTTKADRMKVGPLLAHTDSFWYLFDDEGQGKGELMVIPDSEVKTGRVIAEKPPTTHSGR